MTEKIGDKMDLKRKFLNIFKNKAEINGDIINVTEFLNHLVDFTALELIVDYFEDKLRNFEFNKFITVESSGIIFTSALAYKMKKDFVVVKKKLPITIDDYYSVSSFSFTKQERTELFISKNVIRNGEKLVFIDDFYAHGNTFDAVKELCSEAGGEIVVSAVVVNKSNESDIISLITRSDLKKFMEDVYE